MIEKVRREDKTSSRNDEEGGTYTANGNEMSGMVDDIEAYVEDVAKDITALITQLLEEIKSRTSAQTSFTLTIE